MANCDHDCNHERLGLSDRDAAALTGFTDRAARALAHLREAWCIADGSNRPGIEGAIMALLSTRSLREIKERSIAKSVLGGGGLDVLQRQELWRAVGL